MVWINEMFVGMEKEAELASITRGKKNTRVATKQNLNDPIPVESPAWKALVFALMTDINDFNTHPKRSGQRPVSINHKPPSGTHVECAIYLPGMRNKMMILTLENDNHLLVSVHPDFPKQRLAITLGSDSDSHRYFWMLGDTSDETTEISTERLSEYLLKPVLSLAEISNEKRINPTGVREQ